MLHMENDYLVCVGNQRNLILPSRTWIKVRNKRHGKFIVVHPQHESYVHFLSLQISLRSKKFESYKFSQSSTLPLSIFDNHKIQLQKIHIKKPLEYTHISKIAKIHSIKRFSYFLSSGRVTQSRIPHQFFPSVFWHSIEWLLKTPSEKNTLQFSNLKMSDHSNKLRKHIEICLHNSTVWTKWLVVSLLYSVTEFCWWEWGHFT